MVAKSLHVGPAGSGDVIDWVKLGWTSLGTFACAASANALNQVYEIANDARMERTKRRPLPTGRLSRGHALLFAGLAGSAGIYILATQASTPLPASHLLILGRVSLEETEPAFMPRRTAVLGPVAAFDTAALTSYIYIYGQGMACSRAW